MTYRAVLFDLFRTVILFDAQAPSNRVTEPTWRAAMEPLRAAITGLAAGLDFDRFLDALVAVTTEINRQRAPEYFELPCEERYRRAGARLGLPAATAETIAARGVELQMAQLMAHAHLPADSLELLEELSRRVPLGLISNFDHAGTIHRLLAEHNIATLFAVTAISIEVGRRKPHPLIFSEALTRIGVAANEALYVGDSPFEDIHGARSAGMDAVWINAGGEPVPVEGLPPTAVITRLAELRAVLA